MMRDRYEGNSLEDEIRASFMEVRLEWDLHAFKEAQQLRTITEQQRISVIDQYYTEKRKEELMNKLINKGKVTNRERMRKIQARNKLCNDVFSQTRRQIQRHIRSDPNKYKLFLIGVIVQGIVRMFETKLLVRCLPEDVGFVEEVIEDCIETFNSVMDYQLGRRFPIQLLVDKNNPLLPLPVDKPFLEKQEEMIYTIGGILLTTVDGSITYKNTIDCRINCLRELALPDIGAQLWFGFREQKSDIDDTLQQQ